MSSEPCQNDVRVDMGDLDLKIRNVLGALRRAGVWRISLDMLLGDIVSLIQEHFRPLAAERNYLRAKVKELEWRLVDAEGLVKRTADWLVARDPYVFSKALSPDEVKDLAFAIDAFLKGGAKDA